MNPDPDLVNLFFYYINERERIRIKKEVNKDPFPWTNDSILRDNRFTNVKRSDDKTTRGFKEIYDANSSSPHEVIALNCGIYRYFGTVEFAKAIGWQDSWQPEHIKETARSRMIRGQTVFTGAYVVTNNAIKLPKYEVVTDMFLAGYATACPEIVQICHETSRWKPATERLLQVYGFGGRGFMAKEVMLDIRLTDILPNALDRMEWTPCGPGASRGLNRIFGRFVDGKHRGVSREQYNEEMKYLLEIAPGYVEDYIPELDLHDIQFISCEIDKYLRIKSGERAKRKYKPLEAHKGFL